MFRSVEERARAIDAKRRAGLLSDQEFMLAKLDLYYPKRSWLALYVIAALVAAVGTLFLPL